MAEELSPEKLVMMQVNEVILDLLRYWLGTNTSSGNEIEKLDGLRERLNDATHRVRGLASDLWMEAQ